MSLAFLLFALCLCVSQAARADNAQYFYDPGGRLIAVIDPTTGSATYNYDQAGNITSISRTPSATLGVVQFFPTRGPVGTSVTISGTAFVGGTTTVKFFNNITATPTAVTANSITVPVPSGATTGPIAISTTSPAASLTTAASFTVASPAAAPTITSFSPATQVQGSSVTITGTNFDTANSKVFVNGQAAQITGTPTATSITFSVPLASSGKVTVGTPAGNATSAADLIIPPAGYTAANVFSTLRVSANAALNTVTAGTSGSVSLILFDATANQRITEYLSMLGNCASTWVLSPSGSVLQQPSTRCDATWFGPGVLPQGTYTIVAAPTGTTGFSFNAAVQNVAADIAHSSSVGGQVDTAYISSPGQGATVSFSGTAGQKLAIWMDMSQIALCVNASLQNPDGSYLLYGIHICNGILFANSGAVTLTQTGTYKINYVPELPVGPGTITGAISTKILSIPTDATGTVTIGGTPSFLAFTGASQKGSLTFSGTSGQKLAIRFDFYQVQSTCATWSIQNPDNSFLVAERRDCGNFYATGAPVSLSQTGTYKINFAPDVQAFLTTGTGQITTTIKTVPADVTGTVTIGGAMVSEAYTQAGQNGSLTFSGTSGQKISIRLDFYQLWGTCATWSLQNPDNTFLIAARRDCGNFYPNAAAISLTQTGTYKINFSPDMGAEMVSGTGTLTAKIFSVPADVTASTTIGGATVSVAMLTPGQHGSITFSGTSGQTLNAWFDDYQMFNDCNTYAIVNPDASFLVPATRRCGNFFTGPLALAQTGTYTITLVPDFGGDISSATGVALAKLYAVPADTTGTLSAGTPRALTVATAGQKAVLTYSGTSGQKITVQLAQYQMVWNNCGTVEIQNPDLTDLVPPFRGCDDFFVSTTPLSLTQTGTYKVIYTPDQGGDLGYGKGTFITTLNTVPADATATVTIGGAAATLAVGTPGQHGTFNLSATSGQKVNITLDLNRITTCSTITIFNPDNSVLYGPNDTCTKPQFTISALTLPQTGTTKITVAPDLTTGGYRWMNAATGWASAGVTLSP